VSPVRIALSSLLAIVPGAMSPSSARAADECATVVPIELDDKSHILVHFHVGDKNLRLYLDTGNETAGIDINPEALEDVPVSFSGETRKVVGWKGEIVEERVYTISEVRLGDLVLKDVPGHEYRFSDTADGSFSFAAFPDRNVLIDVPRREFGLFPRGAAPAFLADDGWRRLPFEPGHDAGVVLTVRLAGPMGSLASLSIPVPSPWTRAAATSTCSGHRPDWVGTSSTTACSPRWTSPRHSGPS
jgi:hypothetical protein